RPACFLALSERVVSHFLNSLSESRLARLGVRTRYLLDFRADWLTVLPAADNACAIFAADAVTGPAVSATNSLRGMRGEGAATLRAAVAQPSAPRMGAANTRRPAMYSESEIAYPVARTSPSFSSISSSVTGVCSLTLTRRLKPRMRRV